MKTKEEKLRYNQQWRKNHSREVKAYNKKYYQAHRKYFKKWQQSHKKRLKKYRQSHKKQIKESHRKYWRSLKGKEYNKKYRQTPKGKEVARKVSARRRHLDFIPLNKPFKGCEGHHIDNERIIYIPKELHRSVWHSLNLNINMDKINKLVFKYLAKEIKVNQNNNINIII